VAVRNLATVQWLQGLPTAVESRPGRIVPISLGAKQTGERSAENLRAAFDEARLDRRGATSRHRTRRAADIER
jgi:hypothetical protein